MTIFIIAVGLASVFALFMAGREIEARSIRRTEAQAFSQAIAEPLVAEWSDASQWLYLDPSPNLSFDWVRPDTLPNPAPIGLPILVDPWGLTADELTDDTIGNANRNNFWGLDRFLPAIGTPLPFARVTLPSVARAADSTIYPPLTREQILSTFAGPDAVEFSASADDAAPPLPFFELGRRKRSSDYVPALFLCKDPDNPALVINNDIDSSELLQHWVLIFYKPAAAYQQETKFGITNEWPMGVHQLVDGGESVNDLLEVSQTNFTSSDATNLRRALQPEKWILVTHQRATGSVTVFDACWRKLISATQEGTENWLLALEEALPASWWSADTESVHVYAFESLIHVKRVLTAPLTGL